MIVRLLLGATGMMFGSATVMAMTSAAAHGSSTTLASVAISSETAAPAPEPSAFAELRERQEAYDRVRALLEARDFVVLNAMALEFRTTRARTTSGNWKLAEFHEAIEAALPSADPQQGCAFAAGPLLEAWRVATPSAPSPYIATGIMLVERAWCFRGRGFAREVPDHAWAPFFGNINAAHDLLSAHKDIAAQDPEFYAVMADIYRAESREPREFQALLDEATAREPYYYSLYSHAYPYYLPKWHGSIEDIEAAARFAVEQTREQDGLGAYARYYWYAIDAGDPSWEEAIDWDTMKLAMRDVAERYRDPWNLANFARLACWLSDYETARFYFEAVDAGDNGMEAWADPRDWLKCLSLAAPHTARRSPERCAYAARESWPNEDFEKYCRRQ